MDQGTLVTDGLTVLRLLAQEKIAVKASMLTYTDERGWRLVLAPQKLDGKRALYHKLAGILKPDDHSLAQISLSDIDIVDPNSDVLQDLPPARSNHATSYDNIKLGRDFYQQIITLPLGN